MGRVVLLCSLVALLGLNGFAGSSQFLYANNATFGAPYVYQIDAKTGNVVNTFTNLQGSNTRGVVHVRNIMYTAAGDRYGCKYDLATQTPLGVAFKRCGSERARVDHF